MPLLADEAFSIFPNSNTQELFLAHLEEKSLQQLNYGRNEIYARHGRLFKSTELMEYFSSQSWYHGTIAPAGFQESMLSDIEKNNVGFLYKWEHTQDHPDGYILDQPGYDITRVYPAEYSERNSLQTSGNTYETPGNTPENNQEEEYDISDYQDALWNYGSFITGDFDSNGVDEDAWLEFTNPEEYWNQGCVLHVGDSRIDIAGEGIEDKLYGVCLDEMYTFLVVYEAGPSDDPICHFIRYDEGNMTEVGKICDMPQNLEVQGRVIIGSERCNIIDTSLICKTWYVNEEGMLVPAQEPYYEMTNGWIKWNSPENRYYAQLLEPIIVYEEMDRNSEDMIMYPQAVYFPYTDTVNWVYVSGEEDEGWMYVGDWDYDTARSLFSGLIFAD